MPYQQPANSFGAKVGAYFAVLFMVTYGLILLGSISNFASTAFIYLIAAVFIVCMIIVLILNKIFVGKHSREKKTGNFQSVSPKIKSIWILGPIIGWATLLIIYVASLFIIRWAVVQIDQAPKQDSGASYSVTYSNNSSSKKENIKFHENLKKWSNAILVVLLICIIFNIPYKLIIINWQYNVYGFRITDKGLEIVRGILFRKRVTIPFDRIQNIDIERSFLFQLFDLTTLHIQTAGYSGSYSPMTEGRIPGLAVSESEHLREQLLARARSHHKEI